MENYFLFQKIIIFGVGLIGGSFALALKQAGAAKEIVGFSRSPATLKKAQELNIIDRGANNIESEIKNADLILIATPMQQMPIILKEIAPYLNENNMIMDVGSTKMSVILEAQKILKNNIGLFVPAHPIAGTQFSGPKAAFATLFQNKKVVITPLNENKEDFLNKAIKAWQICGAEIFELTPEMHDQIFASVSHLPHLLSFALVDELANRKNAALYFDFAASGFRDFTRIAASHPEMWRDICLSNRHALMKELAEYQMALDQISVALANKDGKQLENIFHNARQARRKWSGENEE